MDFIAHIANSEDGLGRRQTVEEHCRNCAKYAAASIPNRFRHCAYLAGLLHDMGKYTDRFQSYIAASAHGEDVRRGSVNHSFAAVRFIWERWHKDPGVSFANFTAELLAYAAGGHHGQFDGVSPEGTDGFYHRLTDESYDYRQAKENYLLHCAGLEELDRLFADAQEEIAAAVSGLQPYVSSSAENERFYYGLLARMLLSAVIEGDRRDTAEFKHGEEFDRCFHLEAPVWEDYLNFFEEKLAGMPGSSGLDFSRKQISVFCRQAADRPDGIYRLDVPTGGGKTLASLRYALAKTVKGKERIFFVIPLLSVLDQNAGVIRQNLADDRIVLEHHSNIVRDASPSDRLDENEFFMENFRSPVVITTLVQFLNTLFAGKPSCIRRMAALANSVIIIDEVQSVPRNMLSLFNLAINFLSFCGASIVLCSATQPALHKADRPAIFAGNADIVPYDPQLWDQFRRTDIRPVDTPMDIASLADFAVAQADIHQSVLLICNTKDQAREVYEAVKNRRADNVFHLSTFMCMSHRQKVMASVDEKLGKESLICVSTQLVEAGVDMSFGCVIRLLAGLDNVVQAAGRCNRNRESEIPKPVYIVRLKGENLSHLRDIALAQEGMGKLLSWLMCQPEGHRDLTAKATITAYYEAVYHEMGRGEQDYPLTGSGETLFNLLSANSGGNGKRRQGNTCLLTQAFKTAGDHFKVIEDNTVDVIVPYGDGKEIIAQLGSGKAAGEAFFCSQLLRKAGAFSISLYENKLKKLEEKGGLYPVNEQVFGGAVLALRPEFYSPETGLNIEGDRNFFMEV